MLYDKVKFGVNMYELKQPYDADYIMLNIEWAVANQDKDDIVRGVLENYQGRDYIQVDRCPKCDKMYQGHPAISRRDNKTRICPNCGMLEALEDFSNANGGK